jgi:hypothetical protein
VATEDHIKELKKYDSELDGILSRFRKSDKFLWIADKDRPRLDQIVIELRDFYSDIFGSGESYGSMTVNVYNEGITNMYESPTFGSVERIKSILGSAITKLERTPKDNPVRNPEPAKREELVFPEKVTLKWLHDHVPIHIWVIFGGLLLTAFGFGVSAVLKLSFIQEWFGVKIQ